jgi:hypothetical protein
VQQKKGKKLLQADFASSEFAIDNEIIGSPKNAPAEEQKDMFTQSLMSVQVGKEPSIIATAQNVGTEKDNNSVLGYLRENQSATNVHETGE